MTKRVDLSRFAVLAVLLATFGAFQAKAQPRRQSGGTYEPSTGVAFEERRGWKLEALGGVFTAFGGRKAASNAEPTVGLSLAMDLGTPGLAVFFEYAQAYNNKSCRTVDTKSGTCAKQPLADKSTSYAPDDFALLMPEIGVRYRFSEPLPRLGIYATAVGGYTLFTPTLNTDGTGAGSPHAGLGVGVSYVTRLDSLNVGAEILVRAAFTPMVPSFSFYPRLQYTF